MTEKSHLDRGAFEILRNESDPVEIWVSPMGPWQNVNVTLVDRSTGTVALIDPYHGKKWVEKLGEEGLVPTHVLLTHTHRDHTMGVAAIRKRFPGVAIWSHREATRPRGLKSRLIFGEPEVTHHWNQSPGDEVRWREGNLDLVVTHLPGHAPGHVTFHGHTVYLPGDVLFTLRSGRVDLPGSDPAAQWRSFQRARRQLESLPPYWRFIPGHRYDWIDGSHPDWVTVGEMLQHNRAMQRVVGSDP